jgi:aminoglycoside phosphotransferase family enzyme/predicted kinase
VNDYPSEQQWLIEALQNPRLYDHPVHRFEVIETHISWVVLTGDYVYKIKKPVNFGFLDFSTLEKRRFNCLEELRLNSRLAPQLYLGLVKFNGSGQYLQLNGQGPAIEYAVKMLQFPQTAQLDRLIAEDGLDTVIVTQLAGKVAQFHLSVDCAPQDSPWGGVGHVRQTVMENFQHIRDSVRDPPLLSQLDRLEQWSRRQLETLAPVIDERKIHGFVRECHGDMHLRNIALWKDDIIIFDCLEFNKGLRFIDVISEIAFLLMDLEAREMELQAMWFLNTYLQISGDYEGLKLLRFYKVYRALVRAKVDILRSLQERPGSKEYAGTVEDFYRYLNLAIQYIRSPSPLLLISHGVSGTGKSVAAGSLANRISAIQLRSDVERKRLFSDDVNDRIEAELEKRIYTPEMTAKTYSRLVELAHCLLSVGYSVIIDATNLKSAQRQRFIGLARLLGVRFFILSYSASVETLRTRVEKRFHGGSDVSDATVAVLEHQLATCEPLSANERMFTLEINTEIPVNIDRIIRQINH